MEKGRDVGFKEGLLPQEEVVVPQLLLLNAWFSDLENSGEPAGAHEHAVLELLGRGYTMDEIDDFCSMRDETLNSWRETNG